MAGTPAARASAAVAAKAFNIDLILICLRTPIVGRWNGPSPLVHEWCLNAVRWLASIRTVAQIRPS
jgi:hypothetical protein